MTYGHISIFPLIFDILISSFFKSIIKFIFRSVHSIRAFIIFQVYLYFTIYGQYFVLRFEHCHEYLFKIRSQEEPNTILNGKKYMVLPFIGRPAFMDNVFTIFHGSLSTHSVFLQVLTCILE